jgi:hypothetical protein
MTVSITNLRRRLVTLLVAEGQGTRAVRIAHGHTERGLPDSILDHPIVKEGRARGEFAVERERAVDAGGRK